MGQRWGAGWGGRSGNRVEGVVQNRLHALITTSLGEECPFRCGFHALRRVLLRQANDAETRAVAHLRVWLGVQDSFEQLDRVGTGAARPVQHPRRRPLPMSLMTLATMLILGNGLASTTTA